MRDWLTYRLSDFLLFSARTYYRMFELYHRDIWPAQIASLLVIVMIVIVLVRPVRRGHRVASLALAAAWLSVGVVFHMKRYASINWAATYFGVLFVAQAVLLLAMAVPHPRDEAGTMSHPVGRRAAVAFVIGVALPPIVGVLTDRSWQQVELFGLTPDATAIGSIALVAFVERTSRLLLVVPLIWCAIGAATLWALGSSEAWLSIAAAVVALASLIQRYQRAV